MALSHTNLPKTEEEEMAFVQLGNFPITVDTAKENSDKTLDELPSIEEGIGLLQISPRKIEVDKILDNYLKALDSHNEILDSHNEILDKLTPMIAACKIEEGKDLFQTACKTEEGNNLLQIGIRKIYVYNARDNSNKTLDKLPDSIAKGEFFCTYNTKSFFGIDETYNYWEHTGKFLLHNYSLIEPNIISAHIFEKEGHTCSEYSEYILNMNKNVIDNN